MYIMMPPLWTCFAGFVLKASDVCNFHQGAQDFGLHGGVSHVSACAFQVDHSDMRVSLSLKPNSRQDFGFHTHWDSTGARLKFIDPSKTSTF